MLSKSLLSVSLITKAVFGRPILLNLRIHHTGCVGRV
jgi:hypothetical protein